ncbi:MAG: hypothetical protein DRP12_02985 [Candidatus Aenigmatarchaeota archaeon]|nr:MAG: hypothetical protein DRP12_02985 [Candidatus Aenigmarchaeota archaeon]
MIRISASCLAKIEIDGKYLVGLNKRRFKHGKKVYTPFGGAIEFYESARPFLESLGAVFENGNDIRIEIPEEKIPEFERWFYQRKDREISPYRELREELVDEEYALPDLPPNAFDFRYLKTVKERHVTDRPGQEGKLTQRYMEIYQIDFEPKYIEILRNSLEKPDTRLRLVSVKEILAGITDDGIPIGTNCRPLTDGKI